MKAGVAASRLIATMAGLLGKRGGDRLPGDDPSAEDRATTPKRKRFGDPALAPQGVKPLP